MPSAHSTIFALSSGRPPAAIAVVRVSGPRARAALETLIGRVPEPRRASLARLRDPESGEIIDEALVLWFPAPRSETGEDMAELQLHGGRAVIAAVLTALGRLEGFRPAEAGEFTRRAFENGRLDLTAVEGLADLIGAETEAQRRQAFRQLKGMLGDRAETWRTRLIEALALVEAGIDFSDEADVPKNLLAPAREITRALHEEISVILAQAGHGERLRDGLVVAIAGPPNAGKSTLLNRIARREAAIVSPYAGTTRDVIEVHLDFGGYPVTLLDTAGVRETEDPVEQEGVRRARERAASADLVLWVAEAGQPLTDKTSRHGPKADKGRRGWPKAQPASFPKKDRSSRPMADLPGPLAALMHTTPVWLIWNKADLLPNAPTAGPLADTTATRARSPARSRAALMTRPVVSRQLSLTEEVHPPPGAGAQSALSPPLPPNLGSPANHGIRNELRFNNEYVFTYYVSALTGKGIDDLLTALAGYVQQYFGSESGLITRERHRHALQEAKAALGRALAEGLGREEILAEELRLAGRALGRLTGKVDVEDILDVIFRDFCIGK